MAEGTREPPGLLHYWSRGGEGGQSIRWGVPGDFGRCVVQINAKIAEGHHGKALPLKRIQGLCETLHELNTGAAPGHAAGESHK